MIEYRLPIRKSNNVRSQFEFMWPKCIILRIFNRTTGMFFWLQHKYRWCFGWLCKPNSKKIVACEVKNRIPITIKFCAMSSISLFKPTYQQPWEWTRIPGVRPSCGPARAARRTRCTHRLPAKTQACSGELCGMGNNVVQTSAFVLVQNFAASLGRLIPNDCGYITDKNVPDYLQQEVVILRIYWYTWNLLSRFTLAIHNKLQSSSIHWNNYYHYVFVCYFPHFSPLFFLYKQ